MDSQPFHLVPGHNVVSMINPMRHIVVHYSHIFPMLPFVRYLKTFPFSSGLSLVNSR